MEEIDNTIIVTLEAWNSMGYELVALRQRITELEQENKKLKEALIHHRSK